jgi:hypothetical protein
LKNCVRLLKVINALHVASSRVIYISYDGWNELRCHMDEALVEMFQCIPQDNFFFIGPEEGKSYRRHYWY